MITRRVAGVLLGALILLGGTVGPAAAAEENKAMSAVKQEFGSPNPKAPVELSRFAFLVGKWRGEARIKLPNGELQTCKVTWVGRYILDGYVIEDEYRMTSASGELIVLGMNYRVYDSTRKTWDIKWLNALAGSWMDLGSEELGGVKFDGPSVSYVFKEPMAGHAYTRATYTNVSKTHFTWRGEKSDDRKGWSEFMVVEMERQ